MNRKYLIIDTAILPDYYQRVVDACLLLESGEVKTVSEAVAATGISRSTYYKYKDFIFAPGKHSAVGKKAVISFDLVHKAGVLSEVLNKMVQNKANILTIHQNLPLGGKAHVTVSFETNHLKIDPNEILREIATCRGVSGIRLVAIE